jgi:hypothetical protein
MKSAASARTIGRKPAKKKPGGPLEVHRADRRERATETPSHRDVSSWPKAVRLVCSTSNTTTPFPRGVGILTLRPNDAAEGLYFICVREEMGTERTPRRMGPARPAQDLAAGAGRIAIPCRLPSQARPLSIHGFRYCLWYSWISLHFTVWRTIPPTRGHFVAEFEPAAVTNLTLGRVGQILARPFCAGCHHRAQTIAPTPVIPGWGLFCVLCKELAFQSRTESASLRAYRRVVEGIYQQGEQCHLWSGSPS